MFIYFTAISYEHWSNACDDPKMIEAEHKNQATKEKAAAAERVRQRKIDEENQKKEVVEDPSVNGDSELKKPLL